MSQHTDSDAVESDVGGREIPIRQLALINRLAAVGTEGVADRLTELQAEVTVEHEHVRSGFATRDSVAAQFADEDRVGVATWLPSRPSGYVVVSFPTDSANRAAAIMLQNAVDDVSGADVDLAESALEEMGTMIAGGFVDAWADRFDGEIDVSTPTLIRQTETGLIERVLNNRGGPSIYTASTLRIASHDVTATVFLLPETDPFLDIVDAIDTELDRQ
jgi:chemotaxis protein CheC